jgi:hypothetical protein
MKTMWTPSALFIASWPLACGGGAALLGLTACGSSRPLACNTLVDDGPTVTAVNVASKAPTGVGGTIVDGKYTLTALTAYSFGVVQNVALTASEVQTISGATIQQVGKINGQEKRYTTTITQIDVTGAFWTEDSCPGTEAGFYEYTATATDLRIYDNAGDNVVEFVYTRRP